MVRLATARTPLSSADHASNATAWALPGSFEQFQDTHSVRDVRSYWNVRILAVHDRDRVYVVAHEVFRRLRLAGQNDDRVGPGFARLSFDGRQDLLLARIETALALDDADLSIF